jgi:CubicO group peptidase (beta-lactamase class C family)
VVVKDGHVLVKKGYGYADVAKHVPMDPDRTMIGVGSVSKLFVWTAVMQLVERGKLDLNRDIDAYLDFRIPPTFKKPITLRNLMTHSAGFAERESLGKLPRARRRAVSMPTSKAPPYQTGFTNPALFRPIPTMVRCSAAISSSAFPESLLPTTLNGIFCVN